MLDIFLIIVLLWSLISGWRNGFIRELVSMGGYFVGLFIAAAAYRSFGETLAVNGSQSNMLTSVVAFLLLWIITPIVLGFVANMLTKAVKAMFLGPVNSALGALVSFIKFFVLVGCVLTAMSALHILNPERTRDSKLFAPIQANFTAFVKNAFDVDISGTTGQYPAATHGDAAQRADTTWVEANR